MSVSSISQNWKTYSYTQSADSSVQQTSQQTKHRQREDAIGSFLDKVKEGTVSADDLSTMQDKLNNLQQKYGSSTSTIGGDSDVKTFLDKVQNGTVTDEDVSNMKESLTKRQEDFASGQLAAMGGGMPPMMQQMGDSDNQTTDSDSSSSSSIDSIRSFLDKVKNGTATDSDLSDMKDMLTSLDAQSASSSTTSTTSSSSSSSKLTIKDFLDKVKDGTVTDDDITAMQTTLNGDNGVNGSQMMPPPPPPMGGHAAAGTSSDSDSTVDTISSFLDKVKNGTATDSDVSSMQSFLSSLGTSSASDSTSSTTAASTSSDLTLQEFLEKVQNGTVTDSDLSTMKEELSKQQGEFGAGQMSSWMGGMNPVTDDSTTTSDNDSGSAGTSLSQQMLNSAIRAYEYGSDEEWYSNALQNIKV